MNDRNTSSFGNDLLRIKADLLCLGVRVNSNATGYVMEKYPGMFDEKHVHASHLMLEKRIVVNVCTSEEFVKNSPYEIISSESGLILQKEGIPCSKIFVIPSPKWYKLFTSDGTSMANVFKQHGLNVISCYTYQQCDFIMSGNACAFCSFSPMLGMDKSKKLSRIKETVSAALKENPHYSVSISGGTRNTPDRGALLLSEIVAQIKSVKSDVPISVEVAPPDNNQFIDLLVNSGANSIIMNLEIFDDQLREIFCPGKSQIPKSRYFDAFRYSIKLLGKGRVSSVLIAGIQRKENLLECAKQMIEIGVIPTVIPFRPYDNSKMKNFQTTSPDDLTWIGSQVSKLLHENDLFPVQQKGCTECGACALEIDYQNFQNN